jgi:hypothetical protein
MERLCYMGATEIKVALKYVENDYFLLAYIIMDEGFHIEQGEKFSIIAQNADTLHLTGLNEGQAEILDYIRMQRLELNFAKYNKYLLNPDQIKVLRSLEIKSVTIDLEGRDIKMDVPYFLSDVLEKQFKDLDKKIQKQSEKKK